MDKDTERANLLLGQIHRNQGNWAREDPGLWQERSLQPQATESLETSAGIKRLRMILPRFMGMYLNDKVVSSSKQLGS